ncbi:MAG: hypothetical protein FJZ92_08770 [Chloroflexi bacterium]|nr:hypothetical protein [Chloroflexota bacterium]
MLAWIPFAFGALILLWALVSFTHAATGGREAGLHQLAPTRDAGDAARSRRRAQRFRLHQALNFVLAFGVVAAGVGLVVGALIS